MRPEHELHVVNDDVGDVVDIDSVGHCLHHVGDFLKRTSLIDNMNNALFPLWWEYLVLGILCITLIISINQI